MKYTVIADSCCNLLPKDFSNEKIDFHVVPIKLTVGNEEFIDDGKLDTAEFVAKMKACKTHAKSACPPPEAFAEIMRKSDNIFVMTISSKLSGTYASAMIAAESIKKEFPEKKLFVLDTLTACAGQDHILFRLKELIDEGLSFDEITVEIAEIRTKTKTRFFLHDLTNLIKNGRLGKILGTLLNAARIKLICGDNGAGEIKKHGMSLSTRKGLQSMAEMPGKELKATGEENQSPITIAHVHNEPDASFIRRILESKFGFKNIKTLLIRASTALYASDKGIVIAY